MNRKTVVGDFDLPPHVEDLEISPRKLRRSARTATPKRVTPTKVLIKKLTARVPRTQIENKKSYGLSNSQVEEIYEDGHVLVVDLTEQQIGEKNLQEREGSPLPRPKTKIQNKKPSDPSNSQVEEIFEDYHVLVVDLEQLIGEKNLLEREGSPLARSAPSNAGVVANQANVEKIRDVAQDLQPSPRRKRDEIIDNMTFQMEDEEEKIPQKKPKYNERIKFACQQNMELEEEKKKIASLETDLEAERKKTVTLESDLDYERTKVAALTDDNVRLEDDNKRLTRLESDLEAERKKNVNLESDLDHERTIVAARTDDNIRLADDNKRLTRLADDNKRLSLLAVDNKRLTEELEKAKSKEMDANMKVMEVSLAQMKGLAELATAQEKIAKLLDERKKNIIMVHAWKENIARIYKQNKDSMKSIEQPKEALEVESDDVESVDFDAEYEGEETEESEEFE